MCRDMQLHTLISYLLLIILTHVVIFVTVTMLTSFLNESHNQTKFTGVSVFSKGFCLTSQQECTVNACALEFATSYVICGCATQLTAMRCADSKVENSVLETV